jgi:hypothetical protein
MKKAEFTLKTLDKGKDEIVDMCYTCCAEDDKAWMEGHDRITLYLDEHAKPSGKMNYAVTNWLGSLRFSARVSTGGHNWGLVRHDVWFTDHAGAKWWGVHVGMTDLVHCRKLKA